MAAEEATKSAAAAEEAELKAVEAAAAAEALLPVAEAAFEEASSLLAEVQLKSAGAGMGQLWFMDRELFEATKYMPSKKRDAMQAKLAESKAQRKADRETKQ